MADRLSIQRGTHPNSEMTVVGYAMGLVIVVVLLPLLPFLLVYLVVDRLAGDRGPDRGDRAPAAE